MNACSSVFGNGWMIIREVLVSKSVSGVGFYLHIMEVFS